MEVYLPITPLDGKIHSTETDSHSATVLIY